MKRDTFTSAQYALLVKLFMGQFQPADKRTNPRMQKSETLFRLAQAARGGAIVELGTYQGNGAVSLAWGAQAGGKCPVHTVDPFVETTGWIGEHFEPGNYDIFLANVRRAKVKVIHHRRYSLDLAAEWAGPIALLYWDTGAPGLEATKQALLDDFSAWSPLVIPGGMYAVHEPGGWRFGGDTLIEQAMDSGLWKPAVSWPGFIWTLERTAA